MLEIYEKETEWVEGWEMGKSPPSWPIQSTGLPAQSGAFLGGQVEKAVGRAGLGQNLHKGFLGEPEFEQVTGGGFAVLTSWEWETDSLMPEENGEEAQVLSGFRELLQIHPLRSGKLHSKPEGGRQGAHICVQENCGRKSQ